MPGLGYNVFPEDIEGNPQLGHYVEIRAFPAKTLIQNILRAEIRANEIAREAARQINELLPFGLNIPTPTPFPEANRRVAETRDDPNRVETFYLYVPGGGQNTLAWQQMHEYTDVKLARVATGLLGLGGGGTGGVLPGLLGTPINPQVEVLFRNTQLRTFTFYFLMAPTSRSESERMQWIIERLRWHAAPEIPQEGARQLVFVPPSEFEIKFYFREKGSNSFQRNPNLPMIDRCVAERVDVDFTPQGEFSTFSNGHPVSALLSIQFKELAIVDKNKIARGY